MKVNYQILLIIFLFNSCLSKVDNVDFNENSLKNPVSIEFINSQENTDRGYPFSEATIVNGIIYLSYLDAIYVYLFVHSKV